MLQVHALCHSSLIALGALTVLTATRFASAAPAFADRGAFAITAEDLTGYYSQTLKYWDRENRTVELSRGNFSFGLATGGVRLGLHYFLIPSLSIGGTFGYESISGTNTYQDNPGTWSTEVPTNTRLVIAPKIGYALMFTNIVGLWFRGGLGYQRFKQRNNEGETENYTRQSFLVGSADVLFVCSPVPHFGFFVGPTADRSLAGAHYAHDAQAGDYSHDAAYWRLGLTTGLLGYF